jgi:hypothetical protein
MKTYIKDLTLILSLLISCTSNSNFIKNDKRVTISLANIDISKKWIEIPDRNQPVKRDFRDLRTVRLTNIDNKEAIEFNYGYESQWFEIKRIEKLKDSLIFATVLPDDTTEIITISMKFLDNDRFIARWIVDGVICNYFPFQDTVGNNKVTLEKKHH